MYLKVALLAVLALPGFAVGNPVSATLPSSYTVSTLEELLAVQPVVGNPASAADEPVTIKVLAGRYLLKDSFRIARSKVSILAERGAVFELMGNMNEPV